MDENKRAQKPLMRNRKGWIGFVRSYKKFTKNVDWKAINWGEGTKKPKSVKKNGNKITYIF